MEGAFGSMNHDYFQAAGRMAVTRREFVRLAAAAGLAAGVMGQHAWADETRSNGMIYRTLGRTGEKVSAIGLGGFHIGNPLLEKTRD